jgi:hypothetical protein
MHSVIMLAVTQPHTHSGRDWEMVGYGPLVTYPFRTVQDYDQLGRTWRLRGKQLARDTLDVIPRTETTHDMRDTVPALWPISVSFALHTKSSRHPYPPRRVGNSFCPLTIISFLGSSPACVVFLRSPAPYIAPGRSQPDLGFLRRLLAYLNSPNPLLTIHLNYCVCILATRTPRRYHS